MTSHALIHSQGLNGSPATHRCPWVVANRRYQLVVPIPATPRQTTGTTPGEAPYQPSAPGLRPGAAVCAPLRRSTVAYAGAASSPGEEASTAAPYWRTHISRNPQLHQALQECLSAIRAQGPLPQRLDMAMVYLSSSYEEECDALVEALRQELPGLRNVYGCTGFGVIGADGEGAQEVEGAPALSLTLAAIPQAEVVVRHVDESDLPDGDAPPDAWSRLLGVPAFPECPLALVLLAHPTFQSVYDLLAGLDFAFPSATKLGGLASATPSLLGYPTATFCWSSAAGTAATTAATASAAAGNSAAAASANAASGLGVYRRGVAVLALHGEVHMDLIIAQGCRPLSPNVWTVAEVAAGDPTRVTALASERVAGGRPLPALQAFQLELQSVLSGMGEAQLRRTVSNLTVGIAPDSGLVARPHGQALEPQDFLIRMLGGFDSQQALLVGDQMRPGMRLRFMVRDKRGAQEDLQAHGTAYKRRQLQAMLEDGGAQQSQPFGMFMFTCNGRGSGLYGEESYDARTMSTYVPVPVAGFQCNGEIGRVGNTTHLHGFTCAVGVLRLTSEALAAAAAAAAGGGGGTAAGAFAPSQPQPPAQDPQEQQQQQQQQQ